MQLASPATAIEPKRLARLAKLRYVTDAEAGYSRHRSGTAFTYQNLRGSKLADLRHLRRIENLAIPPAWVDVWICRFGNGHLQVTGRDERGRKQYIYHERWRKIADQSKFIRLLDFSRHLPALRKAVTRDLRTKGLTSNRVLAGMVAVLDQTSIRVGNEEYVRENGSYGLTTLRTRHVSLKNSCVTLRFRGKGGLMRDATIKDKRLLKLFRELKQLAGAHVFQYLHEDESIRTATAADVNDYLKQITGEAITAKDFRTWKASSLVAGQLSSSVPAIIEKERQRIVKKAISAVAETLGNTPTVCRKYYIHSGLIDEFLTATLSGKPRRVANGRGGVAADERAFARFLRRWCKTHRLRVA